jgi:hypothetical protein
MPVPAISDLDDDTLLQEYRRSITRLQSLDRAAPVWAHDIRLMYYLADELAARHLRTDGPTAIRKAAPHGVSVR